MFIEQDSIGAVSHGAFWHLSCGKTWACLP